MFQIIIYIFIGLIALVIVGYLLLQLWFWKLDHDEKKTNIRKIRKLGLEKIKFDDQEQFDILDGKVSESEIRKKYKIDCSIPSFYFFDIEESDYVQHLKKHPPRNEWFNDGVSYNIIEKKLDGYYDNSYVKGKKIDSEYYQTYTELLENIAKFRMNTN